MTSLVPVFVENQRQKIRPLLRKSPHADTYLVKNENTAEYDDTRWCQSDDSNSDKEIEESGDEEEEEKEEDIDNKEEKK